MSPQEEIRFLLKEHGAVLRRISKHPVWNLPNGKVFVESSTPGDWRAGKNSLQELRTLLEIQDPNRGQPGERRPKRPPPPAAVKATRPSLERENALKLAGLMEASLEDKVSALLNELRKT